MVGNGRNGPGDRRHSCLWIAGWSLWVAVGGIGQGPISPAIGQEQAAAPSLRLKVSLPIDEKVERGLRAAVDQAMQRWEAGQPGQPGQLQSRPTIVLEFDTANNLNGRGSHFESCLGLARYLQRPQMQAVRLIAYVPPPSGFSAERRDRDLQARSQLSGHALLVALACEAIWLDSAASLLGLGPDAADPELERSNYEFIARRGTQWPAAVVAALVDRSGGLYRVTRNDGRTVFTDLATRESLSQEGQEVSSEELVRPGREAEWTSGQLAAWGLSPPPIVNRNDLIARLETDQLVDLKVDQQFTEWSASLLRVEQLDDEFLTWATRSIAADRVRNQTNLLLVRIDTLGGYDLRAASQLAETLADLEALGVRTVALLPNGAKGAETIVALACDEIVMTDDRQFGGSVTLPLGDESAEEDLLRMAQVVADRKNRDWSLVAALALGNQTTFEYRNRTTGALRLLSPEHYEDLVDREQWQLGDEVRLANGLSAAEAKRRGIVDRLVSDVDRLESIYPLESWRTLQPSGADRTVQRIARFLSRPGVTHLLLMFGFFMLMVELSSPGLGVPGFLSACCLSLFFWANYLEGSAGALELILFGLGIAFVLIEIFVLPGFGLFGIGGGLMIMAALVLAGQDFVVPRSSSDMYRMAWNLTTVLGAMAGIFAALLFIRYYMEDVPLLNRLILKPPDQRQSAVVEETGKFGHLLGRHGIALTPLIPAGKARFGGEVVSVVTDGLAVDVDTEVRVYEVLDTIIKVEPVQTSSDK